ncbi:MAG: lytic murein transglycosylase [Mycobacterium sp.]|nr:lytic murein transglycosylase [Mycobacterium sp.]
MKHRVGRAMRPALGIAVITPVVLAGAVAAAPSRAGVAGNPGQALPATAPESTGAAVVAAAKPPVNFRFAAGSSAPPPPAAVVNAVGGMRIPTMALSAYRKAEQTMALAAPGCGVSWNLLAGIGRIESSHANGGATDARGTAIRPIYGPTLDGTLPGNEVIVQGSQNGRTVYAQALGPMQFLPGTWSRYASDGDGDGRADPQNLFDATLAAARYLCSGGLNLRNQSQALTAILRYNNSMAYAQNVLGWAAAYATGVAPVDLPTISGVPPALGDGHLEASPEGLGPSMPGLHLGDPMADLGLISMANSEVAGQLAPGPAASGLASEHGCQVICMASQLPPSVTETQQNLPPWMLPPGTPTSWTPPWMVPAAPAADVPTPLGLPPGPVAPAPPAAPAGPPPVDTSVPAGIGAPPGPVAAEVPAPPVVAETIDVPPAPVGPAEVPQGPGPLPGPVG